MIVNGREFNFGRCLKIVFQRAGATVLTIEHAPELHPDKYIAMDVNVTDMPAARAADKPGFMGKITIYNPDSHVLSVIASGATWISDFGLGQQELSALASSSPSIQKAKRNSGMKQYYDSRLRAIIYAGYMRKGVPNYSQILDGYVNGSSFSHKGVDDVLTLGVYDIDMTESSPNMMDEEWEVQAKAKQTEGMVSEAYNSATAKYADTWHNTLVKYIENFETEFISQPETVQTQNLIASIFGGAKVKKEYVIRYVKSKQAWLNQENKDHPESILNPGLEKRLKAQQMINGGIAADNLAGMLEGLCAAAETPVDWLREMHDVSKNTYVIFPTGPGNVIVAGNKATIQIWNYQNLLETPSIDGAGKMTIKMVFNPACVCEKSIALMLTDQIGETDVTRNVASFESSVKRGGGMIGSMASTGNDAAVANNQITGNTNVQSQRKQRKQAEKGGYLFNTGFPIIRVEHNLSTYGPNWTTTVKTVPITAGVKFNEA